MRTSIDFIYKHSWLAAIAFYLVAMVVLTVVAYNSSLYEAEVLAAEYSMIQQASNVGWFLACIFALRLINKARFRAGLAACAFLMLGLRELDMNKFFTEESMLKLKFYTQATELSSFIFLPFALLFFFAIFGFLIVGLRYIWANWRHDPTVPWLFAAWGGLVMAKSFDRIGGILTKCCEISINDVFLKYMMIYEEGMELLLPYMFMFAILRIPNVILTKKLD